MQVLYIYKTNISQNRVCAYWKRKKQIRKDRLTLREGDEISVRCLYPTSVWLYQDEQNFTQQMLGNIYTKF